MKKVLVIDDDQVTRHILVRLIEKAGFMAIQSGNGRHGWETLWENPDIELVVTDMAMPDMDGRELLQVLRHDDAFEELPVLIVSGVVHDEEVTKLTHDGSTRFLRKPVNAAQLISTVKEMAPVDTK